MKHPVWVALSVAVVGAGTVIVLIQNGKPAVELLRKPLPDRQAGDTPKRLIHPVSRIMRETRGEFASHRYDPIDATAGD